MRKTMPAAQRALGEKDHITLVLKKVYAETLYMNPGATLDHLREAVTTLEDAERIARRVLGGAHPTTVGLERALGQSRELLGARETPPRSA